MQLHWGEEGGLVATLIVAGVDAGEDTGREDAVEAGTELVVVTNSSTPRAADAPGLGELTDW